ncbi:MAG: protein kinase [Planctomycetes bacterium]|nr:protein kinase [Planctomycetota bacterium]
MRNWTTVDGRPLQGDTLLGSGGQGDVWLSELDGRKVAVKVYHLHTATKAQREVIERLVTKGSPAHYFLWPIALIDDVAERTFGYVMELREPRFRPLEDFMARRIEPSFRALLTASWQLADGFLSLHSRGLCYRDISFANVFFDPRNGDVRICDNDNVDVSGTESGGILGTQRFMAPEVVRREAVPSDQTDRYSLAVLIFFMLMGGHPLDGEREANIRCLDVPALERLYGTAPLYIFDPTDGSNKPVPGVHDNPIAFHPLYPEFLKALFLRSFTEGLHYPTKRVRESEWRKAFARAIDSLLPCASCASENLYDVDVLRSRGAQQCWSCGRQLVLPPRLRIGDSIIVLGRDTKIFEHHLGGAQDAFSPVGEVAENPVKPGQFGIKNLTASAWTLTRPDGSIVDVPPGKSVPIVSGNKVNFGQSTGEVRA